jgi:hypothetical protein
MYTSGNMKAFFATQKEYNHFCPESAGYLMTSLHDPPLVLKALYERVQTSHFHARVWAVTPLWVPSPHTLANHPEARRSRCLIGLHDQNTWSLLKWVTYMHFFLLFIAFIKYQKYYTAAYTLRTQIYLWDMNKCLHSLNFLRLRPTCR